MILIGIALAALFAGVLIGMLRSPRRQREELNTRVMEAVSTRTRTVLAVLTVATGYHDDELAMELEHPGDIVQQAVVLPDRRQLAVPVQTDRRGSWSRTAAYRPSLTAHAGAY